MKVANVQVFTGDGKGKTTSAIGLAIQAAGASLKVFILQFVKKGNYSEIKALKRFSDLIEVEQFGLGRFTNEMPEPEDIRAGNQGLKRAREIIFSDRYDLVILDEANVAIKLGVIEEHEIVDLMINKPSRLKLLITGRYASKNIINLAESVTEFTARRHYMEAGVHARMGIEF
jgi:cob(I)alamin adenosyltransferase